MYGIYKKISSLLNYARSLFLESKQKLDFKNSFYVQRPTLIISLNKNYFEINMHVQEY